MAQVSGECLTGLLNVGIVLNSLQRTILFLLTIEHLNSVGTGVVELKINGSPAFRCIYVTKYLDTVVVLHSFTKTTNGVDRKAMKVAEQRLKELKAELT